jgi:hypothetical protein
MTDKALIVGINKYPGAPLNGCVDDIIDATSYVTDKQYGINFDPRSVRLLTDARATTTAILERLTWLVTDLKAGDRILFWYSGHGAQVATRAGSGEVDGLDEVICPVDFDWSAAHMIRDKQFHQIFSAIPAGVIACWVSDSCHSDDLERGMSPGTSKSYPVPEDIKWRNNVAQGAGIKVLAPTAMPNIALIAGCKSDQTSADARIDGRYNGALSYYLLKELKAHPTLPMNQLITHVQTDLRDNHYEQIPQLEGPAANIARAFLR